MAKRQVPTGFEEVGGPYDEGDLATPEELEKARVGRTKLFHKLPCTLYTDYTGVNYFFLELNQKTYCMPVQTD